MRLYINNNVVERTIDDSQKYKSSNSSMFIGAAEEDGSAYFCDGYISNLQL